MFRIIDDDGNRSLNFAEFKKGIRDYGLNLEPNVVQDMFKTFDRDGSGSIDFDEFLIALRVSHFTITAYSLLYSSSAIEYAQSLFYYANSVIFQAWKSKLIWIKASVPRQKDVSLQRGRLHLTTFQMYYLLTAVCAR